MGLIYAELDPRLPHPTWLALRHAQMSASNGGGDEVPLKLLLEQRVCPSKTGYLEFADSYNQSLMGSIYSGCSFRDHVTTLAGRDIELGDSAFRYGVFKNLWRQSDLSSPKTLERVFFNCEQRCGCELCESRWLCLGTSPQSAGNNVRATENSRAQIQQLTHGQLERMAASKEAAFRRREAKRCRM